MSSPQQGASKQQVQAVCARLCEGTCVSMCARVYGLDRGLYGCVHLSVSVVMCVKETMNMCTEVKDGSCVCVCHPCTYMYRCVPEGCG